jgi:hypothetical protein
MPHLRGRVLPVTLAAVVLVGGANLAAYAANGHPLLLGGSNNETKTATVTNTGKGPAISLKTSKKSPPLAVNSSKLVKHLNADKVGGRSAADLQTRATTWTIPSGATFSYALNGLKPGTYLATLSILMNATAETVCEIDDDTGISKALTYGANRSGAFSMASGAGIFSHAAGKPVTLNCAGGTAIYNGIPSTVTMIRLDNIALGTTASKTAKHASAHAPTAR